MITSDITLPFCAAPEYVHPEHPLPGTWQQSEFAGLARYIDAGWNIEIRGTMPHLRATAERYRNGSLQFVQDTATELQGAIERIAAKMDAAS